MVEYMYASIALFTNILVKKIWQRLCLPRDFVDNICMVKTDVEGHDLVILRFDFFSPKKSWKCILSCTFTIDTGTLSLGFDPKYFGLNGGDAL